MDEEKSRKKKRVAKKQREPQTIQSSEVGLSSIIDQEASKLDGGKSTKNMAQQLATDNSAYVQQHQQQEYG